ncbi:MAG: GntR family transcriptional regulator [Planctomycetota bacterium]|nr:GntR family transcriptional regulator [Planctomycetota bacterium]
MSVSNFIKQHLISRICAGEFESASLTLEDISRSYKVSVTPVRAAVQSLIEEGYLEKGQNRRLSVVSARAGAIESVEPPAQPTDYYKVISEDLIRESLNGEAIILREEVTAEKYGISRSLLRQVFMRLAGDGLLKHQPRRGWQLRPLRQADLNAYGEVRLLLECKALEAAWPRLVDEDIHSMLEQNRLPGPNGEEPHSDESLHGYLITKANNPYITDFFERHGKYYNVVFQWEGIGRPATIETVRQHRAILEALLNRDRIGAEQALRAHLGFCRHIIRTGLAAQNS